MTQQMAEIDNKARICAALIRDIADLQEKYRGLLARHCELAGQASKLRRERRELAERTKGVDGLLTKARIKYDSILLAVQDQLEFLPSTRQEQ